MIEPVSRSGFQSNAQRVLEAFSDGQWNTLQAIASKCGIRSESSVASRLRDFANNDQGNGDTSKTFRYQRRLVPDTIRLYEYRVYEAPKTKQLELLGASL